MSYYNFVTNNNNIRGSILVGSKIIIGIRARSCRRTNWSVMLVVRNKSSQVQVAAIPTTVLPISSIGFSGAGLLVPYQLGVVQALQDYGILWSNNTTSSTISSKRNRIPLFGCSGGALTAACISAGVTCEEGMEACLQVNSQLRKLNMTFDVLQPGFSLIDTMEPYFITLLQSAVNRNCYGDEQQFLQQKTLQTFVSLEDRTKLQFEQISGAKYSS